MSSTPHAHVSETFHADWTMDVYFCTQTRRVNTISEKGNLGSFKDGRLPKEFKKIPSPENQASCDTLCVLSCISTSVVGDVGKSVVLNLRI